MKYYLKLLLALLVLTVVSCASLDKLMILLGGEIPAPTTYLYSGIDDRKIQVTLANTSDYISGIVVYTGRLQFGEEMCFQLNLRQLRENGNSADLVYEHFIKDSNVNITLNGRQFSIAEGNVYWEFGGPFLHNPDLDPTPLPNMTPEAIEPDYYFAYCFNTTDLDVGLYMVSVTLRTISGIEHSYSWQFEIIE